MSEYKTAGNMVYALMGEGKTLRNRFSALVQCDHSVPFEEQFKIAKLFAAAPDLLEALQEAIAEYENLPHSLGYEFTHLPKMREAVKKALQGV